MQLYLHSQSFKTTMKVLAFILLFEGKNITQSTLLSFSCLVFSCTYAIKCHFCVGEEDCNGSPPVQDCNKDLVTGIDEEAHACQIEWKVDEDGGYDIIGRSCAYGRGGSKESRGHHDCNLNGDGSGSCYCNSDNCNAQASSKLEIFLFSPKIQTQFSNSFAK